MPTPGLSLVGFLDQRSAIELFRLCCVVSDNSDAALTAEWQAARTKLGPPLPGAGYPEVLPVPAGAQGHIDELMGQPWVQDYPQAVIANSKIQMVELAPLLALQPCVDLALSDSHNGGQQAPSLDQLFHICLPLNEASANVRISRLPSSIAVSSRGFNLQTVDMGWVSVRDRIRAGSTRRDFLGLEIGVLPAFMMVARHNGRCFLQNGFHRAVGLCRRGVTHAPCVVNEVLDYADILDLDHHVFPASILSPPIRQRSATLLTVAPMTLS